MSEPNATPTMQDNVDAQKAQKRTTVLVAHKRLKTTAKKTRVRTMKKSY